MIVRPSTRDSGFVTWIRKSSGRGRWQRISDPRPPRTVHGHGSHPDTLRKAGIEDADMVVAVTDSDETNMAACQVAWTLHRTPIKIARVRALEYLSVAEELFTSDPSADKAPNALPIDFVISPEQLVTDHIKRLIQYPGALQVLDFAGGRVRLVGVRVSEDGLLCGQGQNREKQEECRRHGK